VESFDDPDDVAYEPLDIEEEDHDSDSEVDVDPAQEDRDGAAETDLDDLSFYIEKMARLCGRIKLLLQIQKLNKKTQ
jgi:hypothetical protein